MPPEGADFMNGKTLIEVFCPDALTMPNPKRPDRIALELPEPLRKGLDELTQRTGRTRSEEIREAIRQHLKRQGVKL
jgi:hypothetical protein